MPKQPAPKPKPKPAPKPTNKPQTKVAPTTSSPPRKTPGT